MQPSSLFEQEMRDQIQAARTSVDDAEQRTDRDPVLVQAARNHLDGLVDLARRNGLTIEVEVPVVTEVRLEPDVTAGPAPAIAPAV